jgi:hypothetical protein
MLIRLTLTACRREQSSKSSNTTFPEDVDIPLAIDPQQRSVRLHDVVWFVLL